MEVAVVPLHRRCVKKWAELRTWARVSSIKISRKLTRTLVKSKPRRHLSIDRLHLEKRRRSVRKVP